MISLTTRGIAFHIKESPHEWLLMGKLCPPCNGLAELYSLQKVDGTENHPTVFSHISVSGQKKSMTES